MGPVLTVVLAFAVVLLVPVAAHAHIERPSYWPDPKPDCTVTPCAGGRVPATRSLASALTRHRHTTVRVVCKPDSMTRLRRSVRHARAHGYAIRPTDHRTLSARHARALLRINRHLFRRCHYRNIQPAVTASNNDDRVIVMPGLYKEPESRRKLTHDPACKKYEITDNQGGDISGAVSYPYQFHCPNDQNLIAVIGRALGPGKDPHPPKRDRHGIPNLGRCIRCNLQLEGSGVSADDVIVEAGRARSGDGFPRGSKKDVGIRADRADGFVLRNLTVRHAAEHDIYVIEADGYLLERFKTYAGGEYGVLTFVGDHGLIRNCDAAGSGDSGVYPGAGAKTNTGRDKTWYPKARYSQRITRCDSHHNLAGYSGTDGSATHIDHNNFYDNTLGFTTDVFTAAGHPGFPQSGDLIDHNNFYSNNFNPYVKGSPIHPAQPEPVGTGLWIAGGNHNVIRDNHFWNNWRRGVMLFAVPDATVCGPVIGSNIPVPGCDPTKFSTSYDNVFHGNTMGVSPSGRVRPNGTDFWWDDFPTNTGNCWYDNHAAKGTKVTTSPALLPDCGLLPSMGTGSTNEAELLGCFGALTASGYDAGLCPWFTTPPRPGSSGRVLLAASQPALVHNPAAASAACAVYGVLAGKDCPDVLKRAALEEVVR
ncbi:right-handed parallel beta-helix repeat-containing protein [Nocardioides terrisoli]|uniref:right-handed parallel beta-helix repeat-containing protein n=1 Tax=Nocardioides terrisoli TaxID=3388267 RepID=UPI00287B9843|nr:right-handed parallel beta-helix repeat-containing protein [Nocardioides marmorisolisilvae]